MKLWLWLMIAMGIIALMVVAVYLFGGNQILVPTSNMTPEQLEILGIE
jgi:hypothetical protein